MEGTIFDIKRFAVHDGPGIRTTVFFKGCPLNCQWCHNPESINSTPETYTKRVLLNGHTHTLQEEVGYAISSDALFIELEKERVFMEDSHGGVTFSGGEPFYQPEFLLECLTKAKEAGIHTTIDTSLLTNWQTVVKTVEYTDLYLIDLKLMNDKDHITYTNVSNKNILSNLFNLSQLTSKIRIRIPIIPDINNTEANVNSTITFLAQIKSAIKGVDLLPFHNSASAKYLKFNRTNMFTNIPSMAKEEIIWIKNRFESAGFETTIGA